MKKLRNILAIVLLICLLFINNKAYAEESLITIDELSNYLKKNLESEGNVITVVDNAVEITSSDNTKIKIYYNSADNSFYTEETIYNISTLEEASNKLEQIACIPYYGFFAIAEKSGMQESTYQEYATNNGLTNGIAISAALQEQGNTANILNIIDTAVTTSLNADYDYYSIEWTKTKTDTSITVRNTLKMNKIGNVNTQTQAQTQDPTQIGSQEYTNQESQENLLTTERNEANVYNNKNTQNTTANKNIPQTGIGFFGVIAITIGLVVIIATGISMKKYRDL